MDEQTQAAEEARPTEGTTGEPRRGAGVLGAFLRNPRPSLKQASAALRLVFMSMWLAQFALALILALLLLMLSGGTVGRPTVLGPILAVLSLLHLLLGIVAPGLVSRAGGKERMISATLVAALLLTIPAWFLALALVTGQALLPTLTVASALAGGYGIGFMLTGRFARSAVDRAEPAPAD